MSGDESGSLIDDGLKYLKTNWKVATIVIISLIVVIACIWYVPSVSPFTSSKNKLETEIDEIISKIDDAQSEE